MKIELDPGHLCAHRANKGQVHCSRCSEGVLRKMMVSSHLALPWIAEALVPAMSSVMSKLRITGVCILLKGRDDISLDFY